MQDKNIDNQLPSKSDGRKNRKTLAIVAIVLAVALVSVVAVYFGFRAFRDSSESGNSLKNKKVFDQALASYNDFPGISKLPEADRAELNKAIEPEYLAGYVTGFGPNDNDIKAAKYLLGENPGQKSIASYISSIIDSKKKLALGSGYHQGYIFYFWFGNTIVNKAIGENIINYGDPKALEDDRNYARQRAEEAIDQLKKGTIIPQKLQDNLNTDLRLKLNDETNGSIFFTSNYLENNTAQDDGRAESVNSFIKNLSRTGVSDIGIINADPGIPKSGKKREVGYFAVYLDVVLKGTESIDEFNRQLVIARGKLR